MRRLLLVFFLSLGLMAGNLLAQDLRISGVVTNQMDNSVLPGVTVQIKGTTQGTSTDANGNFSLNVPAGSVLVFSFIGMLTEEIRVETAGTLNVALTPDLLTLDEFVVTALGIRREAKTLGYAVQEIQGDVLLQNRTANIANSLTGKVSGLQVIRGSSGPAGSSKIVLRGHSSLTGDNQPLIVVDGIPLQNFTGAEENDFWNPSLDMGSGMADINPDDIESISVLKGASAAALYGSRAGNGVILITTKRGRSTPGMGVQFTSSTGIETFFTHLERQNVFGQGSNGIYGPISGSSWGPRIEGQTVENWKGEQETLRYHDNVLNYFDKPGINQTYGLSFQQQYNNVGVYVSMNHRDDQGLIPGAKLNRTNLLTSINSEFGANNNWKLDARAQYINANAKNRPLAGTNPANPFATMYTMPTTMDITQFSRATNDNGTMYWYGEGSAVNPYWITRYNTNEDTRDRILLSGSLKNQMTSWLAAEIKAGTDIYSTRSEGFIYGGSPLTPTGNYRNGMQSFYEHNFSGLLSASQDNIWSKLGVAANLGGNIMMQQFNELRGNSGELEVPNLFAINNSAETPRIEEAFWQERMLSLYGSLQFNWDAYFFIEGTLRNDWASTLAPDNRSYIYPSLNTSLVVSDMLERFDVYLPNWFSFARLRASIAEVGNTLRPYQLYNTYTIGNDPLGHTVANMGNILFDATVINELISEKEFGFDLRFFNNRLGVDMAWYRRNAINQLIDLPMDPLSGFAFRKVNAGDIENKGLEMVVNGKILESREGLNWSAQFNYSRNTNTIVKLHEDVKEYALRRFDNLLISANEGETYGVIAGSAFMRVEDEESEYFGQIVVNPSGFPLVAEDSKVLGNQQARALMGISNTFAYKSVSMTFLIDGRFGGEMFSGTNRRLQAAGIAKVTAPGGEREDVIVQGVVFDPETQTYVPNTTAISQELYWNHIAGASGNLGIIEANIYDATNVRLRYVALDWNLPRKWLGNTPIQSARIGASVSNVWMIRSYMNGVDPESVYATGTNALGFENSAPPTTRNFLFNLSVNF